MPKHACMLRKQHADYYTLADLFQEQKQIVLTNHDTNK